MKELLLSDSEETLPLYVMRVGVNKEEEFSWLRFITTVECGQRKCSQFPLGGVVNSLSDKK